MPTDAYIIFVHVSVCVRVRACEPCTYTLTYTAHKYVRVYVSSIFSLCFGIFEIP
jgi:hypothetical protein